jgi:hypothetical protein
MGQVIKAIVKHYWSTDATIATPVFSQTVGGSRFEAIWQAWHFSDNSQLKSCSSRLFKIELRCEYLVQNFRSMYSSGQELLLHGRMIP